MARCPLLTNMLVFLRVDPFPVHEEEDLVRVHAVIVHYQGIGEFFIIFQRREHDIDGALVHGGWDGYRELHTLNIELDVIDCQRAGQTRGGDGLVTRQDHDCLESRRHVDPLDRVRRGVINAIVIHHHEIPCVNVQVVPNGVRVDPVLFFPSLGRGGIEEANRPPIQFILLTADTQRTRLHLGLADHRAGDGGDLIG